MPGIGIGITKKVTQGTLLNLSPEYNLVLSNMPTKPSTSDKIIQNGIIVNMKAKNLWSKCAVLDNFSVHSEDSALINWKSPGNFTPTKINTPAWTQYGGFTGSSTTASMLNSNFNPADNPTLVGANNICIIAGIGNDVGEDRYPVGAYDGANYIYINPRNVAGSALFFCNSTQNAGFANANAIGHFSMSKGSASILWCFKNKTGGDYAVTTNAIVNKNIGICGSIREGFSNEPSTRQVRYFAAFSFLTAAEISDFIDIMEEYYPS